MKTSKRNQRTARRFWRILLCLVMVLGMLPTAALAAEDDTEYDVAEEWHIVDKVYEDKIAAISMSIPLETTIQQGGTKAPAAEIFEFELVDTASVPQDLSYYGISLLNDLKIATNGEGTFTRTVDFMVNLENIERRYWHATKPVGSDQIRWYSKTFLLNEKTRAKQNGPILKQNMP